MSRWDILQSVPYLHLHVLIGSATGKAKYSSLKGRWLQKHKTLAAAAATEGARRNTVVAYRGKVYRVLAAFKKTYAKWRIVQVGSIDKTTRFHCKQVDWNSLGIRALVNTGTPTVVIPGDEISTTFEL